MHPGVLKATFGTSLYNEFMENIDKPLVNRLAWVHRSVNDSSGKIEPNWKHCFLALCATKEFQEIQNYYAEEILQKAYALCKEYGLKTNRALMLMFDVVTQNGSIKQATKDMILAAKAAKEKVLGRQLKEKEYLEIVAIKRAQAANPKWVADVLSRKLTIVNGTGKVHGTYYDLGKLGLDDGPIVL
jgi:antitoxin component of RelBE/YafQ-DinJ toxin-antitoxin module